MSNATLTYYKLHAVRKIIADITASSEYDTNCYRTVDVENLQRQN